MLDVFDIPLSERARHAAPCSEVQDLILAYDAEPPQFSPIELAWDLKRQFGARGFRIWRNLMDAHDPFDSGPVLQGDPRPATARRDRNNFLATHWKGIKHSEPTQFDRLLVDEIEWQRRRDDQSMEIDRRLQAIREKMNPTPAAPQPLPAADLIKRSADFVHGFVPPDYLVDGILQRRYFYSMTAATGAGKTAVAMLLTASVASGRSLGDIPVERGTVLYLAGENATDVQMRWLGITQELGLDPAQTDVHFLDATLDLSQNAERISHEVARKGIRPALVIVDTAAAYNSGDDENSNAQAGTYARLLRSLTTLPGGPCVVVLCHPTKRAGDDDLQPRGGGAFIAEVDGNIAVRKREAVVTAAPQGKFRGLENWSLSFALKTVYHPRLKDAKQRDIPTVVALPVSDGEKQQMAAVARRQEDLVLKTVETRPQASLRERAEHLCWRYAKSGKPDSAKVDRALKVLEKEKFIRKQRDGWELTTAGEKELNRLDLQKRDVALQPLFPSATVGATAAPPFPPAGGH